MAIERTMQLGEGTPIPRPILELQQMALGMFLIWDALADDYSNHELVEQAALADWAAKHGLSRTQAIQALRAVKERFMLEPWAHYIHCRDFQTEGWANTLLLNPAGNADVLGRVAEIAAGHPFREPAPEPPPPPEGTPA